MLKTVVSTKNYKEISLGVRIHNSLPPYVSRPVKVKPFRYNFNLLLPGQVMQFAPDHPAAAFSGKSKLPRACRAAYDYARKHNLVFNIMTTVDGAVWIEHVAN